MLTKYIGHKIIGKKEARYFKIQNVKFFRNQINLIAGVKNLKKKLRCFQFIAYWVRHRRWKVLVMYAVPFPV